MDLKFFFFYGVVSCFFMYHYFNLTSQFCTLKSLSDWINAVFCFACYVPYRICNFCYSRTTEWKVSQTNHLLFFNRKYCQIKNYHTFQIYVSNFLTTIAPVAYRKIRIYHIFVFINTKVKDIYFIQPCIGKIRIRIYLNKIYAIFKNNRYLTCRNCER